MIGSRLSFPITQSPTLRLLACILPHWASWERNLPSKNDSQSFTTVEVVAAINNANPSKMIDSEKYTCWCLWLVTCRLEIFLYPILGKRVESSKFLNESISCRSLSSYFLLQRFLRTFLPQMNCLLSAARHPHLLRKMHSTTIALTEITTQIVHVLNQQRPRKHTVIVPHDLSKAFNTLRHTMYFENILQSTMPDKIEAMDSE